MPRYANTTLIAIYIYIYHYIETDGQSVDDDDGRTWTDRQRTDDDDGTDDGTDGRTDRGRRDG